MRHLLFLLLVPLALFADEKSATKYNYVANFEGIPSALVAGCVNAITGDLCLHETDMAVAGPEPLTLQRSFISSDCDFGSLCHNWHLNHCGSAEGHFHYDSGTTQHVEINGELGHKSEYQSLSSKERKYQDFHLTLDKSLYPRGITNTGSGEISARTNPKNNLVYSDGVFCTLTRPNGEQHVHQVYKKRYGEHFYKIQNIVKPANLKHFYRYSSNGKLNGVFLMDHGTHVFSFIKHNSRWAGKWIQDLSSDDGQKVRYYYRTEKKGCDFLSKVERSGAPSVEYVYDTRKNRYFKERVLLEKIKYPDNRFLKIQYYNPKKNVLGPDENQPWKNREIDLNKRDYFRIYRVAALKAPVGSDAAPRITHQFVYNISDDGTSGTTEVLDATLNKTAYSYSSGRLDRITRYLNKAAYNLEKLFWGKGEHDKGNLLTQTWESGQGWIQACRHFTYDIRGNILKETLLGNITGQNTVPVILNGAVPKNNGAERYEKRFTYTANDLLLTETDLLKKVEYRYLPGTDKVTAKFTLSGEKIVKREFFEYNGYGVLTREAVDDGSSRSEADLTGVTERHVKAISLTSKAPYFMPCQVHEFALDLESGQLVLLGRLVNVHSRRGFLTEQRRFDAEGRLVSVSSWSYDSHGNVVSETDPRGNTILRRYDANDNLLFEQGPHPGLKKHFRYDYMNRLIQKQEILEDGTGISTFYRYDLLGNKIGEIDIYGNETRFEYDGLSRLVKVSRKEREERYQYDCLGHRTVTIDGEGRRTHKMNTLRGAPYVESYADGSSQKWRYNLDGSVLDHTDITGLRTRYRYDWAGRPVEKKFFSETDELLYTTSATYNAFHLIAETDAMGVETRYQYDFAGRLVRKTKEGSETLYAYDAQGRECRTTFVDDNASFTLFKEYDDLGQLLEERTEDDRGNIQSLTRYEYDPFGNRSACLTGGSATLTEYDALGRPTLVTDAEGNSSRFIYRYDYKNEKGEKVACEECIDPKGRVTRTVKDIYGNSALVEKINSYGETVQKAKFVYDRCGRKTRRIDSVIAGGKEERESAAEWEYDLVGRVVKMRQAAGTPEQKTVRLAYNRFGQKERFIKADGTEIQYSYDELGRLSAYRSSDGSIAYSYQYDLCGNPLSVADEITKEQTFREYDLEGRITREKLANDLSMEYLYDRIGRIVKARLPDGSGYSVGYRGKKLSKISRIDTSGQEKYSHSYLEHDPETGRLLEAQMAGEAGRLSFEYDIMGRVQSVISDHWREVIAGFDETGNLLEKETQDAKGVHRCSYNYDDLDQLVSESGPAAHSYLYDSLNNRLEKDGCQNSVSLLNQPLRTKEGEYRYDDNGNRIEKITESGSATYRYDALDRLISIESEEGRTDYRYDPFNRRIGRTLNGTEERFLYQGQNEIGLFNQENEALELRLLGSGLGAEIGAAVAVELKGCVYAPVHDHNGNVALLLDSASGKIAKRYRYDAFGCEIPEELSYIERIYRAFFGETGNPWRFSSKRLDAESGLIYFGRRYYDPQSAVWSSQDPLGDRDGPNLYAYLHNNPLTHIDLYGLLDFHACRWVIGKGSEMGWKAYRSRNCLNYFCSPQREYNLMFGWREKQRPAFNYEVGHKTVPNRNVTFINGMNNDIMGARENCEHISRLCGEQKIHATCNPTYSGRFDKGVIDLLRCGYEKEEHVISDAGRKLEQNFLTRYYLNKNAKTLHFCHSEGAIITRNVLRHLPQEVREKIHVRAFAPGAFIDKSLCGSVFHYVSKGDVVPFNDMDGFRRCRETIVLLDPHPDEKGVDHSILSKTYEWHIKQKYDDFVGG